MLIRNEGPLRDNLTSETGASEGTEEGSTGEAVPSVQTEAAAQGPVAEVATQAVTHVEGRRTQLRILKENIQSLSKDVGNFRKSHEAGTKRLEKQVATLRNELAAHTHAHLSKRHEASTKRLEKEVATLRNELAALKSDIAKDAARSRAKQEAILSKILAKVSTKRTRTRSEKKR